MRSIIRLAVLCLAFSGSFFVFANQKSPEIQSVKSRDIVGWVEFVTIEQPGIVAKAKLDSGAKTSSLHAEDIEYFTRDDQQWVRFKYDKKARPSRHGMPGIPHQKKVVEAPVKRMVKIKQHTVDFVKRPVVELDLKIGDKTYTTEFTLTDRDAFIYPVLLGRRFLESGLIVDSSQIYVTGAPDHLL